MKERVTRLAIRADLLRELGYDSVNAVPMGPAPIGRGYWYEALVVDLTHVVSVVGHDDTPAYIEARRLPGQAMVAAVRDIPLDDDRGRRALRLLAPNGRLIDAIARMGRPRGSGRRDPSESLAAYKRAVLAIVARDGRDNLTKPNIANEIGLDPKTLDRWIRQDGLPYPPPHEWTAQKSPPGV